MKHTPLRILSVILCLMLLISLVPTTVLAAVSYNHDSAATTDNYYNVVSKKDWSIAPGIEESEIVLNNDLGSRRQVAHVMVADTTNEYVKVTTSYANMDTSVFATANMMLQATAARDRLGWNVVGAMNTCLSWYDNYPADHIHEPLGFMMIDGETVWDLTQKYGNLGFPTCVVINSEQRPEGMPKVEMKSITGTQDLTGYEEQVIPCSSGFIVENGVSKYPTPNHVHDNNNSAPRSVVGITADGKVVIMENDGRQSISVGMSMYECAELMLDLGCVYACNCDGGGSSTFLSKRPGAELACVNSPSDGSLRETTNGILFTSTAPSDGQFAIAHISSEDKYYTPGSTVEFSAIGTDFSGNAVDIPAEAEWQIKESGMGTIADGVFTSNGTVGTVTAQLVYNGKVAGEASIEIVIPEIGFTTSTFSVKYGTTADLTVVATTNGGMNEVVLKPGDFTITCNNPDIGSIDGIVFTAVSEAQAPANKEGTLTVTLNHGQGVTGTARIVICPEITEVLFDFENGCDDWTIQEVTGEGNYAAKGKNYSLTKATAADGEVHDGSASMRLFTNQLNAKVINGSKDYYQLVISPAESIILENVQSYGVWVYVNDEMYAHEFEFKYFTDANNDGVFDTRTNAVQPIKSVGIYQNYEESGWYYLNVPVGGKTIMIPGADYKTRDDVVAAIRNQSYPQNRAIHVLGYPHTSHSVLKYGTVNGKYDVYFDNFTVDYAADVADRTPPVFGNITLLSRGGSSDKELVYGRSTADTSFQPIAVTNTDDNVLNITARVSDAGDGINGASAKAYVDGKQVASTYSNGMISMTGVTVADGIHRIKFEVADRAGNKQVAIRMVNVASGSDASTIVVEPKDPSLDKIDCGSVYWMDMTATDIETIQSVSATIDLNSSNHWELDHAEAADGFSLAYEINDSTNTADITITRTGKNTQTGEAVLASLPIRVIYFATDIQYPGMNEQTYWTNTTTHFWAQDVKVDVDRGEITYVDGYDPGTTGTFSNESFRVDTEMYLPQNDLASTAYFSEHGGLHVHNAEPVEDKAPTCTEDGFSGRTFCEVCNSVVDWGTVMPANGHDLSAEPDGLYVCPDCGLTYYLKDGEPQSGSFFVDGKMYTFDEDGSYLPDYKYDGFYEINDTVMFFNYGVYYTGYQSINNKFYWFDENGFGLDGQVTVCGQECTFDDGLFVADDTVLLAGSCGENVEYVVYQNGDMIVDGTGAITEYTNVGQVPWRATCADKIKTLTIGKNVTSIGNLAFRNLTKLATVTFENGSKLENISHTGFAYDYALTEIYLPEGIKTVRSAAFYNCRNLEFVWMPASLTLVDRDAFNGCSEDLVASVVINTAAYRMVRDAGIDYILRVEDLASGTSGDTQWTISTDGVLTIGGSGAMADYSSSDAPFKNYVKQIDSVVIGNGVTAIGQFALYGLKNVTSITFEENSSLTTIGWGAFGQNSALTEVTIPASVVEIKPYAFYYDTALKTVAFEDDSVLTTIGRQAFWKDAALESVYIPDDVTSIGNEAFLEADNGTFSVAKGSYAQQYFEGKDLIIREVPEHNLYEGQVNETINWAITSEGKLVISGSGAMEDYAVQQAPWYQYSKLIQTVVVGKNITYAGQFAFYGLKSVTAVEFEENSKLAAIGWGSFGQESALTEITIPASVVEIKPYAFYYDTALKTVDFEDDSALTTIGRLAFWHDAALESVFIPDLVNSIGSEAFLDADYGTFSVVRNSYAAKYFAGKTLEYREAPVYNIYEGQVNDDIDWAITSEGKLVISGEGEMEDYAVQQAPWYQYSKLIETVVVGKDITYTGQFAFYGLKKVTAVEFEEASSLEIIGWGSFGQMSALTTVTIPASVTEIKAYAFYYDTALATVAFEDNSRLTGICRLAFWKDAALQNVYIPDGVTSIGKEAFLEAEGATYSVLDGSYAATYFANYNNVVLR